MNEIRSIHPSTRWVLLAAWLLFAAQGTLSFSAEKSSAGRLAASEDDGVAVERSATAVAAAFARGFFAARDAEIAPSMSPEVRKAVTPAQSKQIRQTLAAQNGAFARLGEAWQEDTFQGLRRVRVPIHFESGLLDMRVVIDGEDRVAGLFFVAHLEPKDPSAAPETAGPTVEEFEVELGDPAIPGTVSRPKGPGRHPGLVLVHGSGPNDRDGTAGPNKPLRDLAWGLARQGILVLRYDKRSLARPQDLAAHGDALTVREEVLLDARAALELLRGRDDTDAGRLFVLGHSMGGTLVPRIARETPRPAGMIILAGSTLPIPEKVLEQTRYILEHTDDSAAARRQLKQVEADVAKLRRALRTNRDKGEFLGVPIGYFRDLEAHDPTAIAAGLDVPALVLQGRRDYQVTLQDFARWESALEQRDGTCLKVYDGLDHLFRKGSGLSLPADYERTAPLDPDVIDDIATWILTKACPG